VATSRVTVFLDYQNVHLMAHGLFMPPGTPVQDALVHPLRVAERLVAKRADDSELSSVRVFRGRPNPDRQPIPAAANDAQTAAWEREDPRLRVIRRDLNYRGWPEHPPREKGVDVALAIALVESALLNEYDVAIVFSGDTDLIPAVEMAFRRTTPRIEVAAWSGAKPLWFPSEMAAGRRLPWCHFLGEEDFDAVRDQAIYIPKP
jgi:hypothetical protein